MNSFTLKQSGYKLLDDNCIVIMGKEYRYFKPRDIEGKVKTVTVKRDALGDIYLYIVSRRYSSTKREKNQVTQVGLDFGLTTFLTTSTGEKIVSPLFFKQGADQIKQNARRFLAERKALTTGGGPGWTWPGCTSMWLTSAGTITLS